MGAGRFRAQSLRGVFPRTGGCRGGDGGVAPALGGNVAATLGKRPVDPSRAAARGASVFLFRYNRSGVVFDPGEERTAHRGASSGKELAKLPSRHAGVVGGGQIHEWRERDRFRRSGRVERAVDIKLSGGRASVVFVPWIFRARRFRGESTGMETRVSGCDASVERTSDRAGARFASLA